MPLYWKTKNMTKWQKVNARLCGLAWLSFYDNTVATVHNYMLMQRTPCMPIELVWPFLINAWHDSLLDFLLSTNSIQKLKSVMDEHSIHIKFETWNFNGVLQDLLWLSSSVFHLFNLVLVTAIHNVVEKIMEELWTYNFFFVLTSSVNIQVGVGSLIKLYNVLY